MALWWFLTALNRDGSGLCVTMWQVKEHGEAVLCFSFQFVCLFLFTPAGSGDVMAFLTLFMRRQLPLSVSYFARVVKLGRPGCGGAPRRKLHGSVRQAVGESGPWGRNQRGPEQPLQQYPLTDLDKADALVGSHFRRREAEFLTLQSLLFSFGCHF